MFRTQKDTIRKGIQNNVGFTLIEMIVTVAIIAIFSGVVVTLIGTGSNLFRGVSGNTKSQIDSQETLNAIEDLIIDANRRFLLKSFLLFRLNRIFSGFYIQGNHSGTHSTTDRNRLAI